jgi:hypothetical protein
MVCHFLTRKSLDLFYINLVLKFLAKICRAIYSFFINGEMKIVHYRRALVAICRYEVTKMSAFLESGKLCVPYDGYIFRTFCNRTQGLKL